MKRLLASVCAVTLITAPALAQSTTTKTNQPPAATATNPGTSPTNSSAGTAAGPSGIQAMNTKGAVKLTFYNVQPADFRVSKLIGAEVYNLNDENVGEITDLIVDNGKNIRGVIVSVGGFLGIGDRNIAVQPNSLTTTENSDGDLRVVINTNKEELKNAPQVKLEEIDKQAARTGKSKDVNGAAPMDSKMSK